MRTHAREATGDRQAPLRGFAGLHVHLIGIGGSGMSGAATLLLGLGADVSGSDLAPFSGMGPNCHFFKDNSGNAFFFFLFNEFTKTLRLEHILF